MRYAFSLSLFLLVCLASGREPTSAQPLPAAPTKLSGLLVDAYGQPIESRRQWVKQRRRLKALWAQVLGELPKHKPPLKVELLPAEDLGTFTRQRARYQVEAGVFTDGYLLIPKVARRRLPAVVIFHPTTPFHARGVAGLEPDYPEDKQHGLHLVRRDYVVWCPRNFIYSDGADWAGNAARVRQAHPGWAGMTRMVWDATRAIDFLESLENVDRHRIGCLGHSLGGKQVLYAMAFDERYKVGVSSEGGIGLSFSNWEDNWYLGRQVRDASFHLDNHQILALIAPRPFLLLAGDSADGTRSLPYVQAAMPVYELFGAADKLALFNHHQGHSYPLVARREAEAFLDRYLK